MPRKNSAQNTGSSRKSAEEKNSEIDLDTTSDKTSRLRIRAAWMYFVEEKTQNEIAQHLGLGRVTVVRLLSDARERNEVRFSIQGGVAECIELERRLERRFGIREAIVVPLSSPEADACLPISAATGMHVGKIIRPDLKIWESLAYMSAETAPRMSVVSLLGGITKAKHFNPAEFAWRFSSLFKAECYMMTAPAIVDSAQTKTALIDRCGLKDVFDRVSSLDAVLISVGDMASESTPYRYEFISEEVRKSMVDEGAVGEFLFNYFDVQGRPVRNSIDDRVMSAPPESIANCPERIIASGGVRKSLALLGALRAIKPTTFITDIHCAKKVLDLAG
jgi:DNA-binding transcriptional regulator LsrR (DeoR family)